MVEVTKIGNKTLVMDGKILSLFRKGSLLRQMYYGGYEDFDGANGGVWKKYINIPIKTVPLENAIYVIEIDDTNVSVYNAKGDLKAQASIASEFWDLVRSDGNDIRVFDESFSQLYFSVRKWSYGNKATIFVRLPAGKTELNIAFGNQKAIRSVYENPLEVYDIYDTFEDQDISDWQEAGASATWGVTSEKVKEGNYALKGDAGTTSGANRMFINNKAFSAKEFKVEVWVWDYWDGSTNNPNGVVIQAYPDTSGKSYVIELTHGDFAINKFTGTTSFTSLASQSLGIEYDNWFKYEILYDNGEIIAKLYDNTESLLATLSATDTEYQTGYVGVRVWRNVGYFDIFIAYKATDPATFDTPRILEF